MNIKSPVITGDECPGGTAVFHTTFFSGPNSDGSRVASPTPLPLGPRNCIQSAEKAFAANRAANRAANMAIARRIMSVLVPETVHRPARAHVQLVIDNRRSRVGLVIHIVHRQNLPIGAGLDHSHFAFLAG